MGWFILWVLFLIFAVPIGCAINNFSQERKKQKEAETIRSTQLENALSVWNKRVVELGIDTNSAIIYRKYANAHSFYPMYCWKDSCSLNFFYTKPTADTAHFDDFQYPENLRISFYYDSSIRCYYRTGSQGSRTHTDFSRTDALMDMSNRTTGVNSYMYAKKALEAAKSAETHTEITDDRKTVLELTNGSKIDFRIDAFEIFQHLIPEKCR